ncbi:reverse transcriptase domain-containing protein [Clostridium sp. WILCCON 0269]|uniref:Reverse transcriptase domain-containing protein n=1 Tax=Candidatus Clostridium eludens TaxID=3381663 RepID=A0ABW8SSJ0_9CLOT
MEFVEEIKRAYKKLKASVYYDKTQAVLRNDIVTYESSGIKKIESDFSELSKMLHSDSDVWNEYEQKLLSSINTLTLPKKLEGKSTSIIINDSNTDIRIKDNQYFITMDIEGHLLGVLWILYIGKYIDEDIYEYSYGNRLNKKLMSEETQMIKFTNNLFKPYFTQYESWRDYGLEKAQEHLKNSKDVVILTMDFKKFFYSVHFQEKNFEEYFKLYCERSGESEESEQSNIIKRLNKFVYKVLVKYSSLFKMKYAQRVFLPIGFLPSNILSNDYLKNFDSAIINRWNPLYYGRYVDDIIVVDKVEKNSDIFNLVNEKDLETTEIIEYFLCNCNADKVNKCPRNAHLLHKKNNKYYVNNTFLGHYKGNIEVNNDKVKVFYFRCNHSDALITKFKKVIALNKSEFRYMPEDDNILESGDYSEIFELQYSDSINKLSGVKEITIDKYRLSKFLGKYLRIGGLINDRRESMLIEDILKIFDERAVIENYILWEKVIEILVINDKFEIIIDFVVIILKSISNLKCKPLT